MWRHEIRAASHPLNCRVLGFEADTDLDTALEEIIPWIKRQIAEGGM